jgi:hypothetical protein
MHEPKHSGVTFRNKPMANTPTRSTTALTMNRKGGGQKKTSEKKGMQKKKEIQERRRTPAASLSSEVAGATQLFPEDKNTLKLNKLIQLRPSTPTTHDQAKEKPAEAPT